MTEDDVYDGRRPGAIGIGLRVIVDETPVTFALFVAVAVLRGFVPAGAAALTGRAVSAVPQAIAARGLSGGGRPLAVALVAVCVLYGFDQVVESLVFPLQEGWGMRLFGRVKERMMRAVTAPPLLDHELDADVRRLTDLAARDEWPNIYPFANACVSATTWLVGAVVQAALVARFSVPMAVIALAGWLAVGSVVRRNEMVALLGAWEWTRRAHYFRRLALEHRSAGEVRAFGLGPWLLDRFDSGWREGIGRAWASRALIGRRMVPFVALLAVANVVGITLIARGGRAGHLDPGELTTVVLSFVGLAQLALPQEWTESLLWGATRLPALVELEGIVRREVARVTPEQPVACGVMPAREIRFESVTFAYPGRDTPVLRSLDLRIEAGRSLAVVGVNGAGKTTLVKLLARLHDPSAGRITVDGVDLRALDPVEWQHRVAAIFQDYARWPLSAAENVALGPLGTTVDSVALDAAAEAAGAAEVVRGLDHGWDTVLSRRYAEGAELSGGQWQRIALARAVHAIHAGAGVLVLDEPTANLDARGEAELFERFLDVARGATTVLISHRFSTVRRADRIVVLEDGAVIEEGAHDELLARGGRYAALFALQADRYRLDEEVPQ